MIEEVIIDCPSCGESVALEVNPRSGDEQELAQDCPACHATMDVFVRCADGEVQSVSTSVQ